MKKSYKNIGILSAISIIALFAVIFYFWHIFGIGALTHESKPKIKYGEFPFRLEYEINGEQKLIEDTIICEFDGFETVSIGEKSRKWKTYLKNEKEMTSNQIILLDLQNDDIYDELGRKVLNLYFFGGNGHYYMNDNSDTSVSDAQDFSHIAYSYKALDETVGHSTFKAQEAFDRFKIKLISWEAAPPIQNTFK